MNKLNLQNVNGIEAVDSRQVAEVIEKKHKELLRDIRHYSACITESKIALSDFFIENTYTDITGRTLPCYWVTCKGCELIANKLTGQKGVIFTALYVNSFHNMESKLVAVQNYSKKSTSAGEVASLIKTLRSIMKEQKSDPKKIADMANKICQQFGIDIPDNFVEKNPFENQLFLVGFIED